MPRIHDRQSPFFFFSDDTAATEIYSLSLHDALPICNRCHPLLSLTRRSDRRLTLSHARHQPRRTHRRSEEHTSELQSPYDLVCRLLLEKKKDQQQTTEGDIHWILVTRSKYHTSII